MLCIICNLKQPEKKRRKCSSCRYLEVKGTRKHYYKKNRKRILDKKRQERIDNPELFRERRRRYYHENKKTEYEYTRNWLKNNPEAKRNYEKRLRPQKRIVRKYSSELQKIYSSCPEGMVVDHIIPINNKLVCGLHVPCNLQYLSPSENSYKRNRFDGTHENKTWKSLRLVFNK
jgi:hypothetical protein